MVVVGVVTGTSLLSRSRPPAADLPQLLQLTEHCLGIGRVPMYHPPIRMEVLISLAGLATAQTAPSSAASSRPSAYMHPPPAEPALAAGGTGGIAPIPGVAARAMTPTEHGQAGRRRPHRRHRSSPEWCRRIFEIEIVVLSAKFGRAHRGRSTQAGIEDSPDSADIGSPPPPLLVGIKPDAAPADWPTVPRIVPITSPAVFAAGSTAAVNGSAGGFASAGVDPARRCRCWSPGAAALRSQRPALRPLGVGPVSLAVFVCNLPLLSSRGLSRFVGLVTGRRSATDDGWWCRGGAGAVVLSMLAAAAYCV